MFSSLFSRQTPEEKQLQGQVGLDLRQKCGGALVKPEEFKAYTQEMASKLTQESNKYMHVLISAA